jgi:hypothetical protein
LREIAYRISIEQIRRIFETELDWKIQETTL